MAKATWILDPAHTLVEFSVKHMMISTVKGRFGKVEGFITGDPAELDSAEVGVTVDVSSIDTRETQRDQHLLSPDFFDVAQYPTLTFKSKKVTRKDGDEYRLVGDLTIHGVTKEIGLDLVYEGQGKDPWGNERIGLTAEGKLDRKDFGLTWNAALEAGGILVGDQVKLTVHGEAIKQA